MRRPRLPIAGLMAGVALAAVDLAIVRSIVANGLNSESGLFYVCGILPAASLLVLVAVLALAGARRDGLISPFVVGFELTGWAAVLAFLTFYSVFQGSLIAVIEPIAGWATPTLQELIQG